MLEPDYKTKSTTIYRTTRPHKIRCPRGGNKNIYSLCTSEIYLNQKCKTEGSLKEQRTKTYNCNTYIKLILAIQVTHNSLLKSQILLTESTISTFK